MAFGGKKAAAYASSDRLAAIASGGCAGGDDLIGSEAGVSSTPRRRASVEPDLSRIRPRSAHEDPEARKKRLAAKTVNFSASFLARAAILAAAAYYGYELYLSTGSVHRGLATGMFAMVADFGRVTLKAMTPGTK